MCPFGLDQSEAIRQKVLFPLKAHTFKLSPRSNRGDMQEGADDKNPPSCRQPLLYL